MVILLDYPEYIKCKDIFLTIGKQFINKPNNNLELLRYHKIVVENNPDLTDYFYQFALTACFEKKIFDARELEKVFDNSFKTKDMYNLNGNECDISTLNTAFIVNHLVKNTTFKKFPIKIFNAPLQYNTEQYFVAQKNFFTKEYIEKSKALTGQPNNDISIGDILYDIKHKTRIQYTVNYIYSWTYDRLEENGVSYLNNLLGILKKNNDPLAELLSKQLGNLIKIKNMTLLEKFDMWNDILSNNWFFLEKKSIQVPIVIPITKKPFVPLNHKNLHNKLHLDTNVTDDYLAARKAIAGIVNMYGKPYIKNAEEITQGLVNSKLLGETFNETVD